VHIGEHRYKSFGSSFLQILNLPIDLRQRLPFLIPLSLFPHSRLKSGKCHHSNQQAAGIYMMGQCREPFDVELSDGTALKTDIDVVSVAADGPGHSGIWGSGGHGSAKFCVVCQAVQVKTHKCIYAVSDKCAESYKNCLREKKKEKQAQVRVSVRENESMCVCMERGILSLCIHTPGLEEEKDEQ
jgi:hypothetical protein